MAVDPRKFLLNTDYEMDKIIYYKQAYLTPDSYGHVTIDHNLGMMPLITGVWSKTSDFKEPHSLSGIGGVLDPSIPGYATDTIVCYSNETKVGFSQYSGPLSSPTYFPFYVRIIGFEPSNSHRSFAKTSQQASKFVLNTDYNYLKLFKAGVEPVVLSPSTGTYEPITIQHNLGYHAQGLFWTVTEDEGYNEARIINGAQLSNIYTDAAGVESHSNNFIVYPPSTAGMHKTIHYRIYYDQAK